MERKFNFVPHEHLTQSHRNGWRFVCDHLQDLHTPYSWVDLYSWGDKELKERHVILSRWSAFLHNPVSYPEEYPEKYSGKVHSLSQLVSFDWFADSVSSCAGLYVLSCQAKSFLEKHVRVPVVKLWHPVPSATHMFDYSLYLSHKRVIHVGQWMRRYHSFLRLRSPNHDKIFLQNDMYRNDYKEMRRYASDRGDVRFLNRLSDKEFDKMLMGSVIFLDLYDVGACNTVLECIMSHSPLLVNRLPGTEEYLGSDYPLFFRTLEEAEVKLSDDDLILEASEYLSRMDKSHLTAEAFINAIKESVIYKSLPRVRLC